MNDPQAPSQRTRLQVLLAIPERQRTDAEWDEINEIEILLAAGNRQVIPEQGPRGNSNPPGGRPGPGGGQQHHGKKRQGKRFHQRPPGRNRP
jgi:hypothetical protein